MNMCRSSSSECSKYRVENGSTNSSSDRNKCNTPNAKTQSGEGIRATVTGHLRERTCAHARSERQDEAHRTPWHAQQTAVAAVGTVDTVAKGEMRADARAVEEQHGARNSPAGADDDKPPSSIGNSKLPRDQPTNGHLTPQTNSLSWWVCKATTIDEAAAVLRRRRCLVADGLDGWMRELAGYSHLRVWALP